jgi:HAE1 family hydrophobic/amphiphilic exporter-1
MSNSSSDGVSTIRAVFESNTDEAANQVNVLNSVQTAMAELPKEVSAQGATVKESELSYLQVYNIEMGDSSYDKNFLNGFYDLEISDSLSNLKGVGQVILLGGSKPAYRLWLDPQKLKRYNLTAASIIESLEAQNQIMKGGLVGGPPFTSNVTTTIPLLIDGNLEGVEELNQLIVKAGTDSLGQQIDQNADGIVYLSDVGQVQYSLESLSEQSISSSNGTPSLSFGIIKQPGYNTVNTSRRIDDYITKTGGQH